jgi:hypothetical protein
VPAVTRDELLAAFREIALNAMEHGAGFAPEDLPHAAVSNPPDAPLAHAERRAQLGLRPGGFGLLIARKVVDEFLHSEKANEVLLIKHTRRAGARGALRAPRTPVRRLATAGGLRFLKCGPRRATNSSCGGLRLLNCHPRKAANSSGWCRLSSRRGGYAPSCSPRLPIVWGPFR